MDVVKCLLNKKKHILWNLFICYHLEMYMQHKSTYNEEYTVRAVFERNKQIIYR